MAMEKAISSESGTTTAVYTMRVLDGFVEQRVFEGVGIVLSVR